MKKFGRLIVISIVFLGVVSIVVGLLFPSTVVVSRAIDISAPKDSIYTYLKDVDGWKQWMDGLNDNTVTKTTPLHAKLGRSEVIIQPSTLKDSILNASWQTSNNGIQAASFELYQEPNQRTCVVHWQFNQHLKWYPWERFSSMMSDKIMGTMMEKNLNNLKNLVENKEH